MRNRRYSLLSYIATHRIDVEIKLTDVIDIRQEKRDSDDTRQAGTARNIPLNSCQVVAVEPLILISVDVVAPERIGTRRAHDCLIGRSHLGVIATGCRGRCYCD